MNRLLNSGLAAVIFIALSWGVIFAVILLLSGCAVTCPLGEDGKYGEIYAGYRLPVTLTERPVFLPDK